MRKSLSKAVAMAALIGASEAYCGWSLPSAYCGSTVINDPYKPRPRSKGEKARNRRNRHD